MGAAVHGGLGRLRRERPIVLFDAGAHDREPAVRRAALEAYEISGTGGGTRGFVGVDPAQPGAAHAVRDSMARRDGPRSWAAPIPVAADPGLPTGPGSRPGMARVACRFRPGGSRHRGRTWSH